MRVKKVNHYKLATLIINFNLSETTHNNDIKMSNLFIKWQGNI